MSLNFSTKQTFTVVVDGEEYELKKVSVHRRTELIRDLQSADKEDALAVADQMQALITEAGLPAKVYKKLLPEHIAAINEVLLGEKKN